LAETSRSSYLDCLHNRIDPVNVPFSDRGSRLLLYCSPGHDAFYLNLAERLENLNPGLEAHRSRPPFLSDITLLDGDGQPLRFELETYPHVLHCQTRIGRFSLTYVDHDTLAVGLPPAAAGLALTVGDLFRTSHAPEEDPINHRRVELSTTVGPGEVQSAAVEKGTRMTLIAEPGHDVAIHISLLRGRATLADVKPFSTSLAASRARWEAWFERVPAVDGGIKAAYAEAWWTLANNLVAPLGRLQHEALMPCKTRYIGVWNWDAGFHAAGLRHADPELARDQLRIVLSGQLEDGMLPDVVHDEGIVDRIGHPIPGRVTKPPVMAWAALKIHAVAPDLEFLREIYPTLKRWNRWWFNECSGEIEGLAHYTHPYSSGLDDSPLWEHGFPVVAPDLNTYLVLQMQSLAGIALQLGLTDEARAWQVQADALVERMLAALYDPQNGFFWHMHQGQPIQERTPFSLYPLWTGGMSPTIEAQLVGHLTDPDSFWGPHPLSTVARISESYAPTTMWRGPVWININYIFIEALARVGRSDLAGELRRKTIGLVAGGAGVHEFYNPETGAPSRSAAPAFGWSAALFIDLCLQEARAGQAS
jgi:hypothetical protein